METIPDKFKTGSGLVEGTENIAEGFNEFFTNIGKKLKECIG